MADVQYKLGQTVQTNEGREGIVRYVGGLHIAPGEWLGLELPDSSGKNDGSVKGERYFTCKPGYGIFVREGAILEILKQPPPTAVKTNGSATPSIVASRPRPSTNVSAEVARRRQSLMSTGSGSAAGSRLSAQSPNLLTTTSISSTTSTPRTGTPSMMAKASDQSNKSRPSVSGRPSMGPPGSNSRSSSHTARSSLGGSSSFRNTTTSRPVAPPARPIATTSRTSPLIRSSQTQTKPNVKQSAEVVRGEKSQIVRSPRIKEETEKDTENKQVLDMDEGLEPANLNRDIETKQRIGEAEPAEIPDLEKVVSTPKTGNAGIVESRAAHQREMEQLKAKIRTLEKKRQEDRDKLKQTDTLQSDRDRFENIIYALQTKLRANNQELTDVRSKCEEAEKRANAIPEYSGELESEMELATLDKEMAEERAEALQMELEVLKTKHEELELEVEILREENTELGSTMSPEEKANAGWMQMERERERLKDALLRLRDMSQENEHDLKIQIEELREQLDESEKTAGKYTETADKLSRAEETNKHLMGQLEAVESNDEVVEAMEVQREQQTKSIEQLRNQIQDLEEHIQVTDELEIYHLDEERRLHAQLDENEALLSESHRRMVEQDRVVEDLEYTLTKFRDVVQGLQSDIDELRRSREISEMQANDISSKSRAMMDLNLRLQNNAAKTQTKTIDTELSRVKAELATKHVDILNLFTPEIFQPERKPILALLCFGRIRSKASLVGRLLGERLRERSHLNSGEEIFQSYETIEGMEWISDMCHRFEDYMQSCSTTEFTACSSILEELEPVERTVTNWLEALKKDELARNEPEHLKRMREILADLADKKISETPETKAMEIVAQMSMVEKYADSLTGQLTSMVRVVQSKLGSPRSEDEESLVFDKGMNQLATKARTVKYLSGKVVKQLKDLHASFTCVEQTSWASFEETEQAAELLAREVRTTGFLLVAAVTKLDTEEHISYTSVPSMMNAALQQSPHHDGTEIDPFTVLSSRLTSLQSLVDGLQSRASDVNNTISFEPKVAPWVARAKEIKNTRFISPEVQENVNRLERRNHELGTKIAEREKTIEEMALRVELAEKRFKESKEKGSQEKAMQQDLETVRAEKQANEKVIFDLRAELVAIQQTVDTAQSELETLRTTTQGDSAILGASTVAPGTANSKPIDDHMAAYLTLEANLMQAEISALQAAVRYLREENRSLRIPISETLVNSAKQSWLNSSLDDSRRRQNPEAAHRANLERDGLDVWTGLIDVAKALRPIRLGAHLQQKSTTLKQTPPSTSWQPTSQTTRYIALKQREELERWEAWRDDFVKRAKIETPGARDTKTRVRAETGAERKNLSRTNGSLTDDPNGVRKIKDGSPANTNIGVTIVES